jgi:hypothetical protein
MKRHLNRFSLAAFFCYRFMERWPTIRSEITSILSVISGGAL